MKFAVFVFLDIRLILPGGGELKDGVYLFPSRDDAEAWILKILVASEFVSQTKDGFQVDNEPVPDAGEAICQFQDSLCSLEFFHVFDVHEVPQ